MVYDVAFALVWADDGQDVTTRNEAYAFASCADCAAVAVGFQVVLIVGQTDVIVPENLSAAANYNCVRCLTYALASQLVLTLDGPLSADGMARLNALWQQIAEYGRNLQNVPLSEIQGRLGAFKQQIMEVIKSDPSATPGGSRGTAPPATTGSRRPPDRARRHPRLPPEPPRGPPDSTPCRHGARHRALTRVPPARHRQAAGRHASPRARAPATGTGASTRKRRRPSRPLTAPAGTLGRRAARAVTALLPSCSPPAPFPGPRNRGFRRRWPCGRK